MKKKGKKTTPSTIVQPPLAFVRSGFADGSGGGGSYYIGDYGHCWSRTANTSIYA